MSHMSVSSARAEEVSAEYIAAHKWTAVSGREYDAKAYVRLSLGAGSAEARVILDIEHVRYLAEVLPGLVMDHDAAEHVAKEQAAAIAEAA